MIPRFSHLYFLSLLWLALWLGGTFSHAESLHWAVKNWGSDDGIPNNDIASLYIGKDGALWIWTFGGPVRFDGKKIRPIKWDGTEKSMRYAIESSDDAHYVLISGGIEKWKNGKREYSVFIPHKPTTFKPNQFFEDTAHNVWISGDFGALYVLQNQKIITPQTNSLSSSACMDTSGKVWVADQNALHLWDGDALQKVCELHTKGDIIRTCPSRSGGIWIASGNEIMKYEDGIKKVSDVIDMPLVAKISSLLEDKNGRLWCGTFGSGLYYWDGNTFHHVSISNQDVWCMSQDSENNLWVGTGGGGLCSVRPASLYWFRDENHSLNQTPRTILQDHTGKIWIVLQTGNLVTHQDGVTALYTNPNQEFLDVACITEDTHHTIWLASNNGRIYQYNDNTFSRIETHIGKNQLGYIRAMWMQNDGTFYTAGEKLHMMKNGTWQEIPIPPQAGIIQTWCYYDADTTWLGTNLGKIIALKNNQCTDITANVLPSFSNIRQLITTPDHSIWMGTTHTGLWCYKNHQWYNISSDHGLPDDTISKISLDSQNRLWLVGDKGITVIRVEDAYQTIAGKIHNIPYLTAPKTDTIKNLQANSGFHSSPAAFQDGKFYFPMRGGVLVADPKYMQEAAITPIIHVEKISINQEDAQATNGHLQAPAGVKNLRMEISAVHFTQPDAVKIQYRMADVDSEWLDSNSSIINYTTLPPGSHTLYARTGSTFSDWSEPHEILTIDVPPLFWQRKSTQAIAIISALTCTALLAKYISQRKLRIHNQKLKREAELNRERTRIARDMHDQVGASLTRIGLLSEIIRHDPSPEQNLHRLTDTAKEAVIALDEIVWAINPRHDTLASLLDYIGQQTIDLLSASGVSCRLNFPEQIPELTLPTDFRHHIFLITREAINNALKHAQAKTITLHASVVEKEITFQISDDGKGISPERNATLQHDGMSNIKERTAEINGRYDIQSDAEGTTIIITAPLPPEAHTALKHKSNKS